jgi:hypothetical protein
VLNAQSYFACEDRFSVNTGLGFGSVKKNEFILSNLKDGLKSIFETDFKRHSEPRLPSTAQINH